MKIVAHSDKAIIVDEIAAFKSPRKSGKSRVAAEQAIAAAPRP